MYTVCFYHMYVHLLILLLGFVKTFKAQMRNMNVLYSQSVYVWAVLDLDMVYEVPMDKAGRATSSS